MAQENGQALGRTSSPAGVRLGIRARLLSAIEQIWLRAWFPTARRAGSYHLLIAPPGSGNIGDQAMLEAYLHHVSGQVTAIVRTPSDLTYDAALQSRVREVAMPNLLYGSFRRYMASVPRLAAMMAHASSVSIIGADIMDGAYNDRASARRFYIASTAARAGLNARVLAFSWNTSPGPRAARAARAAPPSLSLFVRDPVSSARLRQLTRAQVVEVADAAFALPAQEAASECSVWVSTQISEGRRVAIVNLNSLVERITPQVPAVVAVCGQLIDEGWSILFVPHDPRNSPSDFDLATAAQRQLGTPRTFIAPEGLTPSQVRTLASEASLVITARMHLAILSLTAGVPTISISYQGKVEGLYEALGLESNWLEPDDDFEARLGEVVGATLPRLSEVRDQVARVVPSFIEKATRNFVGIEPIQEEQ